MEKCASSSVTEQENDVHEAVDHPSHYQGSSYEVLDIIDDFSLNFNLGNTVKYILRAGLKDPDLKEQDLRKALFYLKRELEER